MSQENVEVVRRSTDAYNRRDLDGAPGELGTRRRGGLVPLPWLRCRRLSGAYEIKAHWQRLFEAFDEVRVELIDPIEEVEDGVLVAENLGYLRGRDGIEVQTRTAWLIRIRDGEVTSFTLYQTKQEALEAAGQRSRRWRGQRLSGGREAKAVLPALRCHPDTLLDTLSALRQAFLDLAPGWVGSPSLIALSGHRAEAMDAAGLRSSCRT